MELILHMLDPKFFLDNFDDKSSDYQSDECDTDLFSFESINIKRPSRIL